MSPVHVFARACDLIDGAGEVLSVVTPEIDLSPFGVVVPPWEANDAQGFVARVDGRTRAYVVSGRLFLGELTIDARGAEVWDPRVGWEAQSGRLTEWQPGLRPIREILLQDARGSVFRGLLDPPWIPISGSTDEDGTEPEGRPSLESRAVGLGASLSAAVGRGDLARARSAATRLAGLGAGLTPAGDDFIVGCLHAVWACAPRGRAGAIAAALARAAAPRTTPLSAAWIRAAARGEAGEPWHRLWQALSARDRRAVASSAERIARVGHTSGADALIGFVAAVNRLRRAEMAAWGETQPEANPENESEVG